MLIEFDHGMKNFGFFFDMEWQILISFFDEIFDLGGKFDVHFFFFLKNPIAEKCQKYHKYTIFNEIKMQKRTVIDVW